MNTYYATIQVEEVEIGTYVTADNFDAAYEQAEAGTKRKHPGVLPAGLEVITLAYLGSSVRHERSKLSHALIHLFSGFAAWRN
jgi:hypothetical protein